MVYGLCLSLWLMVYSLMALIAVWDADSCRVVPVARHLAVGVVGLGLGSVVDG